MDSQHVTGDNNVQVLVKDSTHVYVRIGGEPRAVSLLVPPFRETPPEGANRDLALLLATTTITKLVGRQGLWDDCIAWCSTPEIVSAFCLTGRGGSGKTRFALELVHSMRELEGWDARFVRFRKSEAFDLWTKTAGGNHVLLVFDNASDNAAAIAESLLQLAEHPRTDATRCLRILLLARTASWESGWLQQFEPTGGSDFSQSPRRLFRTDKPIVELDPLSIEHRIYIFREAYEEAAKLLQLSKHAVDETAFHTQRAEEVLRDPLTLMMAAVVGLHNGVPQALSLTRVELAQAVARLLVTRRLAKAFPENEALALHLVAYATLSIGLTRAQALEALDVESQALHLGLVANPSKLAERMAAWFPGKEGDLLGAIEPDIVGEAFVLDQLKLRQGKATETVLRASASRADRVAQFLVRAAQDFSNVEGGSRAEPLKWMEALVAKGEVDDFGLLMEIGDAMPESSVVLRPLELRIRERIFERIYAWAEEISKEEEENWVSMQSGLAWALEYFSISLRENGQCDGALARAGEAVTIRRELVGRDRAVFLPYLAASLNNLGAMQSEVGDAEGALTNALEASDYYRELTDQNRNVFLCYLAASLNNLGNWQNAVGNPIAALANVREAVTIRRELAVWNGDAFLSDLAMSLTNLGTMQSEAANFEGAYANVREAVTIRRELVSLNRDAFLPDLAGSLTNLGALQNKVGDTEGALASAREASGYYRELAGRNREAFLPDLAASLTNLGNIQSTVGDLESALVSTLESIEIKRQLTTRNRGVFLPSLALTCGAHGQVLAAMERYTEAAEVFADGVRQLLPLIEERPLQPLIFLGQQLLWGYFETTEKSGIEMDERLLKLALQVLRPHAQPEGGEG